MTDHDHPSPESLEAFATRIARPLRGAEAPDPMLRARVMATIRAAGEIALDPPVTSAARSASAAVRRVAPASARPAWWRRAVTVRVTPVGGLAMAAAVAAVAVLGARAARQTTHSAIPGLLAQTGAPTPRPDTVRVVQFVFVAPGAATVSVVGNFNNWDRAATQLVPAAADGAWTATVALPPGRHEYAFLIDGTRWAADPRAHTTVEDDFGVESSVITIGADAARSI